MKHKQYADAVLMNNLRKLCADKNITQGQLAATCYKERKSACAWINGASQPSALDLKNICLNYRISADELLGLKSASD